MVLPSGAPPKLRSARLRWTTWHGRGSRVSFGPSAPTTALLSIGRIVIVLLGEPLGPCATIPIPARRVGQAMSDGSLRSKVPCGVSASAGSVCERRNSKIRQASTDDI